MIKNKIHGDIFPIEKLENRSLNPVDKEYHKLLVKILKKGVWKENRTGTKTLSIFGPQLKFKNVGLHFPLLTTKKIFLKGVIGELLWFLEGSTDKNRLRDHYGTTIWEEWDAPNPKFPGDMGPIYGNQWVNWKYNEKILTNPQHYGVNSTIQYYYKEKSINQLQEVINTLKTNPDDRRMIVTAWAPHEIPNMALPPCHWSYQFYTAEYPNIGRKLHIKMNIRSLDVFLGAPFNIASYAILLMMMANEVNMIPGDLYISVGDAHIYENHLEYIYTQLSRDSQGPIPRMLINKEKGFWDFEPNDFEINGYDPHPNWKNVPIAV